MSNTPSILNVGCGTKTSPQTVNIDWSFYLRFKQLPGAAWLAPYIFRERLEEYYKLSGPIMVHNLKKGLPFPDTSFDAVYHSHLLEHLDRDVVSSFLREVKRVLKPGGVHRIAVPDLERLCRDYLRHLDLCESDSAEVSRHDAYVSSLIEQMVRKEASGTKRQKPLRRWLENRLLGDARRRGQTHQWMYDRANLEAVLREAGFSDIRVMVYDQSNIPGWNQIGLNMENGHEYKPESIYVEAVKA